MHNSAPIVRFHGVAVDSIPVSPAVEALLRQILEFVSENEELGAGPRLLVDRQAREVVLDVHVNGVCYTLTRSFSQRSHLSPREQEIVGLVAQGLPTKVIAETLHVSLWTVATHLRRVFLKLGVKSRAEMVAHVLRDELLLNE